MSIEASSGIRLRAILSFAGLLSACHRHESAPIEAEGRDASTTTTLAIADVRDAAAAQDAAPPTYRPIKPKAPKFADLAKAIIPSYEAKKHLASVKEGKVKDIFDREAPASHKGGANEPPPPMRPGAVKEAGRLGMKDGRLAVWLQTDEVDLSFGGVHGFVGIVHQADDDTLVADATGVWSSMVGGTPITVKEEALAGKTVFVEDQHLEGTGEGGSMEGVKIWALDGNAITLAGSFPITGDSGPGSGTEAGMCYPFVDFVTTMTFGDTLELAQQTEWSFRDPSDTEHPNCRPPIKLPTVTATLRLVNGKLEGAAPKDPRDAIPSEAKPYLHGKPRKAK